MSSSTNESFDREGVIDYERRRYRGLDQRLVDLREKRILRRILRRIAREGGKPGRPAPLVLDAPCGYGRFSGLILGQGARLVSADLSRSMVERALQKKRGAGYLGGTVADVRGRLPFREGSFDHVVSMRLFHHLREEADRRSVLREFARVAERGVILSFYRASGIHVLQRRVRGLFKKTQRRIRMLPGRTFEKEAAAAGFTVVRVIPLFRGVHAQHVAVLKKS